MDSSPKPDSGWSFGDKATITQGSVRINWEDKLDVKDFSPRFRRQLREFAEQAKIHGATNLIYDVQATRSI